MASGPDRTPAESIWERRQARRLLRLIELRDGLASRWETTPSERVQAACANLYRQVIGVHPSQRTELKAALERLVAGEGDLSVEKLIDGFRHRYGENGPSSSG